MRAELLERIATLQAGFSASTAAGWERGYLAALEGALRSELSGIDLEYVARRLDNLVRDSPTISEAGR